MKTIKNLTADELRKSILQLAIQGKLVKQNPDDEPASELVKKIYEEKKKLVAEGKIKKDKNESYIFKGDDNCYYEKIGNGTPIKLEDLPFEIPDSWTWIRQKNICWLDNGEQAKGIKLPYLEAKVIRGKAEPTYVDSGVIVKPENKVILVDGENSGEIMTPPFEGYMGSTFKVFSAVKNFNYEFLLFIFLLNKEKYKNSKIGAAIPHLNKELFKESYIAVPPLKEQSRIVSKIQACEPLITQYSIVEEKLSNLETEFPEKLKKSILQYAIEGKLVKQDPNDEPASVLLERIKVEKEKLIKEGKIKRDKNESYIYQGDDKNYYEKVGNIEELIETPFEINDQWSWTRLKDISIIQEGAGIRTFQYKESGIQLLTVTNILEGKVDLFKSKKYVSVEEFNQKYLHLQLNKGDIVSSCSGASWGKTAIFNENDIVMLNTSTLRLRFYNDSADNMYLYYLTKTPLFKKQLVNQLSGMQPNFGYAHYSKLLVPLPSLNTQHKIVELLTRILIQI